MATELSRVRSQQADAEARADNVRDALKDGRSIDTLANVVDSPLIQQLRQQEIASQAQLADLSTSLGSRHPRILAIKSQIAELNGRIRTESQKVLASLENEANIAKLREQELTRQMDALKQNSGRAGEEQVQLQSLEREASADRNLLDTYLARYSSASTRLSPDALPANARIISNALAPAKPYFPKVGAITIVAMLAALLLTSVSIMLAELFSGRALRPVEAAPMVGYDAYQGGPQALHPAAQTIASIAAFRISSKERDDDREGKKGAVAIGGSGSDREAASEDGQLGQAPESAPATAEDDEIAATASAPQGDSDEDISIAAAAAHLMDKQRSLAVCVSPEGDEGSAVSVILARLLAEEGMKVILVDMTETGCPTRLMARREDEPGLNDVLARKTGFSKAIHGDRLSPAHLMPRGVSDAEEAMRSAERLPMILDGLRDAYQTVIVECGAVHVEQLSKLLRNGADHDLIVTAVEPHEADIAQTMSELHAAGYSDLIVMTPGPAGTGGASDINAA